jgi:hypothetical protein
MHQNPILSKPSESTFKPMIPMRPTSSYSKPNAQLLGLNYGAQYNPTGTSYGNRENHNPSGGYSLSNPHNFNQHPTLSKNRGKLPGQSRAGLSHLSGKLPHTQDEPVAYVLNNVYQPKGAESQAPSESDIMIPQPKKDNSLKNSNLSYGTNPISNHGGHPFADSNNISPQKSVSKKKQPSYVPPKLPAVTNRGPQGVNGLSFGH